MVEELEWKTRRDRINKRLKALNLAWKVVKYSEKLNTKTLKRHAVEEYPAGKRPAEIEARSPESIY